jgi:predicted RNA binding protein YcfA (HicA-like mRNA interferase family)
MGKTLTARQVVRRIEELGGYHVRTRGSHATYVAERRNAEGAVLTTARAQVPIHSGDVAPGTCARYNDSWRPCSVKGGYWHERFSCDSLSSRGAP